MNDAPETLPPCPFCGADLIPSPYRKAASDHRAMRHPPTADCLLSGLSWHDSPETRRRWARRVEGIRNALAIVRAEEKYQKELAVDQHQKGIDWRASDWASRKLGEVAQSIENLIPGGQA